MQVSQKRVLGSGWIAAGLILFNGTVGGGLLNLPASIMAAGGFSAGFPLLFVCSNETFVTVFRACKNGNGDCFSLCLFLLG